MVTQLANILEFGPAFVVTSLLFVVSWFALEETAGVNAENWK